MDYIIAALLPVFILLAIILIVKIITNFGTFMEWVGIIILIFIGLFVVVFIIPMLIRQLFARIKLMLNKEEREQLEREKNRKLLIRKKQKDEEERLLAKIYTYDLPREISDKKRNRYYSKRHKLERQYGPVSKEIIMREYVLEDQILAFDNAEILLINGHSIPYKRIMSCYPVETDKKLKPLLKCARKETDYKGYKDLTQLYYKRDKLLIITTSTTYKILIVIAHMDKLYEIHMLIYDIINRKKNKKHLNKKAR